MNLTNQAIGSIMMALQKGIMEKQDITELLQDFNLVETDEGLVVENPPIINFEKNEFHFYEEMMIENILYLMDQEKIIFLLS